MMVIIILIESNGSHLVSFRVYINIISLFSINQLKQETQQDSIEIVHPSDEMDIAMEPKTAKKRSIDEEEYVDEEAVKKLRPVDFDSFHEVDL